MRGGGTQKRVQSVSLCWNVPLPRDICTMKCTSLLPTTMKLLPLSGCNHCYCAISTRTDTQPEETTAGFLSVACRWQLSVEILGNSGNFLRTDSPIFRSLILFCHFACRFIITFLRGQNLSNKDALVGSFALTSSCHCLRLLSLFWDRTLKDGFFFQGKRLFREQLRLQFIWNVDSALCLWRFYPVHEKCMLWSHYLGLLLKCYCTC